MDSSEICRESIEWCDIWVTQAKGGDLPRALLVGDSITRSYYQAVADSLRGRYACARLATSKCVGDPVLFEELDLLLSEYTFDVIHFNNGMHGWDYTEAAYASGLGSVLDRIRRDAPDARLILALTTPVRSGDAFAEIDEMTERVVERNRIASALAAQRGIEINDLFDVVIDHPEYHSDRVHFNPQGQAALGSRVADAIDRAGPKT
jgi:lysophospholipase L1-like esterase